MQSYLNLRLYDTGLPKTTRSTIEKLIQPIFDSVPSFAKLVETNAKPKKGSPLLGFCVGGGNENSFLQSALDNPESPAVILVHNKQNSFAAGCEISARLNEEHRRGNRAPSVFCSVEDTKRLKSVINAAAVCNYFNEIPNKIGIIGDPSNWLIGSGYYAETLPSRFGIQTQRVSIQEFLELAKKHDSVYQSLKTIISKYGLSAFTIRCFDLLQSLQKTSCLEVSKLNDENIVAACEGDIPATVTMMIMQKMAGSPVFMANPTGLYDDTATFAHCTIPKRLCTTSQVTTHFESGIGTAVQGKVIEGKWTVARFGVNGQVMTDTVHVTNPKEHSPHQCRTQIVTKVSKGFAEKLRKGEVLGNHFLFVPGDIKDSIEIFSNSFYKWTK